ncbi:MAG: hypothetical protein WBH01_00865 [Dehalococcoidia bacterium]
MSKSLAVVLVLFSIIIATFMAGWQSQPGWEEIVKEKASSLLLMQVDLRKEQMAEPTAERLKQMQTMGMRTEDLTSQRIYIHFEQEPTQPQLEELQDLGITAYADSWIPPVGDHPTGFILADMPIDKLNGLPAKDYIIKLNTAEQVLEPQSNR